MTIFGAVLLLTTSTRHGEKHHDERYAPVNILIDERPDGVHLSYDRMASLLAPYGSAETLAVALDLDSKTV